MKSTDNPTVDWSACTSEGSERAQLRVWSGLSLRRKLEALEEMCDHARRTLKRRQERGLPYIDPFTGVLVPGSSERKSKSVSLIPQR